jgi:uncharacterized protein (DUF983 family)
LLTKAVEPGGRQIALASQLVHIHDNLFERADRAFQLPMPENDACPHCGEELFHQRSDDAPPYMTISVVGHIIGTFMILVEEFWPDAPIWLHAMVWPTITLILSLWLLPIIKGGLIGHQWALRMHGFETVGRAATGQSPDVTLW